MVQEGCIMTSVMNLNKVSFIKNIKEQILDLLKQF